MLPLKVGFMFAMWSLKVVCVVVANVAGVIFKHGIRFVAMRLFYVIVQQV